jgi:hypothetical protein
MTRLMAGITSVARSQAGARRWAQTATASVRTPYEQLLSLRNPPIAARAGGRKRRFGLGHVGAGVSRERRGRDSNPRWSVNPILA